MAAADPTLRERDQLLATVSHDLKTPLTAIRRQAEIIVMGGPRRVRLAAGKRQIFGDTVDFVLKHAPCRVMVAAGRAAA